MEQAAGDAAIHSLYTHYRKEVETLTHEYLAQASSDDEGLAEINDRVQAEGTSGHVG